MLDRRLDRFPSTGLDERNNHHQVQGREYGPGRELVGHLRGMRPPGPQSAIGIGPIAKIH